MEENCCQKLLEIFSLNSFYHLAMLESVTIRGIKIIVISLRQSGSPLEFRREKYTLEQNEVSLSREIESNQILGRKPAVSATTCFTENCFILNFREVRSFM